MSSFELKGVIMKVAAITAHGLELNTANAYRSSLKNLVKFKGHPGLLVFPGLFPCLLARQTGWIREINWSVMPEWIKNNPEAWFKVVENYLALHGEIARELDCYLVGGTVPEIEDNRVFLTVHLWEPGGNLMGRQRQTHLHSLEKKQGYSRGEELPLFSVKEHTLGVLAGSDGWHPEAGRILALQGASLVAAPAALPGKFNCWLQAAGIWAQVQQNQFWAVESQLCATFGEKNYNAESAVLGPCEITPGQTGYLERGGPGSRAVVADLREEERQDLLSRYPLLQLLNPRAYGGCLREYYDTFS